MTLDAIIAEAITRYRQEFDRYLRLSASVAEICRAELTEGHGIRAQVTARAKSAKSFADKLRRCEDKAPGTVASVEAAFARVRDLAGVRVATYEPSAVEKVVHAILHRFEGREGGPISVEHKDKYVTHTGSFYRASHCDVFVRAEELDGSSPELGGIPCEIQVCSIMAQVWNEVEHDIGYKSSGGALSEAEQELLRSLGHLTRNGDRLITQLMGATEARLCASESGFTDVFDFVARVRAWFPGIDIGKHAGPLFEALRRLELAAPTALEAALEGTVGLAERASKALASLSQQLPRHTDETCVLDPDSSDLLLSLLLPKYAARMVESAERHDTRNARRVANIAAWYLSSVN